MALVYARIDIYPGSEIRTVLASDAYSQYVNFFASFNNTVKEGDSFLYTWGGSLGLNYWTFMAYYLGGIFTPLVLFFNNLQLPDFLYFLTLLKIGSLGISFYFLSNQLFVKIPKWGKVILAISYALMSFVVAHSEILMWLDVLIWLPVVIVSIHRVMDSGKIVLLFISTSLLLVSNFYMAYMAGIFSFLYFMARFMTDYRKYRHQVVRYVLTSALSVGGSLFITLPVYLDLKNNGESFEKVNGLFTSTTGIWDIVIKNMVGVYDSTKVYSTPFIYVGLLPLIGCIFFFVTKKIPRIEKIAYGLLGVFIFISFYFQPLNLAWHGFHSPNMFLFRFSFLFSFMVLLLAGYGWNVYTKEDLPKLTNVFMGLGAVFLLVKYVTDQGDYEYLYTNCFLWTAVFLIGYFVLLALKNRNLKRFGKYVIPILFLITVSLELGINTFGIVRGIAIEWVYPARKHYTEPHEDIQTLVDQTKEENKSTFYRMENLTPVSVNENMNFDYHGVSFFSSIRNRHSSEYLNGLGFRSLGTNLNIRYANNTLLMDALLGVKYNISKQDPLKFGYKGIRKSGDYTLYKNDYVMPLGFITDEGIFEKGAVETQTTLLSQLAKEDLEGLFDVTSLQKDLFENVKETKEQINATTLVTYKPKKKKEGMILRWKVKVPANKQAYLSIFPVNYRELGSPSLKLYVNGTDYSHSVSETGQYYNLGYYKDATEIDVTAEVDYGEGSGKQDFTIVQPDVLLLDTDRYANVMKKVMKQGVDFTIDGRKASANVELDEEKVILTTIPYDKGWVAYVDGEKVEIPTFKEAMLTVKVPEGKHNIEFVFIPQGLLLGEIIGLGSLILFVSYLFIERRKKTNKG
ncbi:hypothetical protein RV18_GL000719 [Enterococcus termitis]|nr:hypothetical protein RV18_GL000719 [Enterococcus termitis]